MGPSLPNGSNYTDRTSKDQLQSRPAFGVIGLILLGFASIAFYVQIFLLGDLRQRIPEFLVCYFVLFTIYLWAAFRTRHYFQKSLLWTILGFALLFRLILFFSEPCLSDDIHRYLWEGYLQSHGVNPFKYAPDAPELVPLRNDVWVRVNNKDASAIYPPLLQAVHAAAFVLFRSAWGFKLLFLLAEAALIWALLRLLKLYGRISGDIVFYAWNPLVIVEIAGSGHHDACVVGLLLAAALFGLTAHQGRAVLALAGSILCKLYPVTSLPFFLRRIGWRHLVWLPIILVAGYLPYASAGSRLFAALLYYREKWRFNGFLYMQLSEQLKDERQAEQLMLLVVGLVIGGACLYLGPDLLEQLYWATGAVLLCAPTLFPWYLIWMVPFLCFFPSPAWLLLTGLSPLSYYVLIDWWTLGMWRQNDLFLKLQYFPFYGLLTWNFLRVCRAKTKVRCANKSLMPK
jgi:hypothetical protein